MKFSSHDLLHIVSTTLAYYTQQADNFWEGTCQHDVSQNISALLAPIEAQFPFTILDFGCGPGRDLKTFTDLGHIAVGLDGVERFATMARAYSGCEVWRQDFLDLRLPNAKFDGVFANASLFHVPQQELPRVLAALRTTLKPGGVLFSSNPRGNNEEGWQSGRFGSYLNIESWRRIVTAAGFVELNHYYRPAGVPLKQQSWLASVWRRVDRPTVADCFHN